MAKTSLAAILVGNRDHWTQIWKGDIQESFQQSLVEIGSEVSEEKIFFKFHPPFFLICIIGQNRQKLVPVWVPFKIVSDRPALHSRWPLLPKIEISSNGQNCSILSQNVPKFELYKHNDERSFIKICLICIIGIYRLKEKFHRKTRNTC
jgi:hypothetical protein